MQNIKNEAPEVYDGFINLTRALQTCSGVDEKTKELIIIGIMTADKATRGITTHVKRALEHGAEKKEIVSAILFALPVVGITKVTPALQTALDVIKQVKGE